MPCRGEGAQRQAGRRGHLARSARHLGRGAVVDGELGEPPRLVQHRVQRGGPAVRPGARGGLSDVADDRQRPGRDPPQHHAPRHRGQLLGLVDHDVPVGPGTVRGRPLGGGQPGPGLREPLGEQLGADQPPAGARPADHLAGVLQLVGAPLRLPGGLGPVGLVVLAEQLGGLVEQRDVGRGPRGARLAAQQRALGLAEVGCGLGEAPRLGPQVLDQPLGGQRHPREVQRDADLAGRAQVLDHLGPLVGGEGGVDGGGVLVGEPGEHVPDEGDPGHVVRAAVAPGARDRLAHVGGQHAQEAPVEADVDRLGGHPLAGGDRAGHHGGHLRVALEPRHLVGLRAVGDGARQQVGDRRGDDPGLPERGQHLVDVAQEGPARAEQQHTGTLQRAAMGVEQVGGAVQGDGGLAGAGTALDHQRTGQRRPDDRVLLGLDGGDDVAHPSRSAGGQRREQGALPGEHGEIAVVQPVEVQHLVLDAGDGPAAGDQVAAPDHAVGPRGGRAVEGLRGRRAPVREQRGVLVVGEPDPPDVARRAVRQVEPAEGEALLDAVELGQAILVQGRERVPLGAVLRRAGRTVASHVGEACRGLGAQRVQARVVGVDGGLLDVDLAATCHGAPSAENRPSIIRLRRRWVWRCPRGVGRTARGRRRRRRARPPRIVGEVRT